MNLILIMALKDYIHNKPVIDTGRLLLRPMTIKDVPDLKEWMPDKSLYTYWGKAPSKNEKNPQFLFIKENKPTKSFHLGIALKDADKVIGDIWVYLIENNRMAALALRISKAYQKQGYAADSLKAMVLFCFKNTELKRLYAQIDTRNIASQKLFEKCGFIKEGLIRQGKIVNSWCGYYIYAILDSDID